MAFDAFCFCAKSGDRAKADSSVDTFIGETQDEKMKEKGAFEIINFELGAENTINIGSMSGGGGAGKASFKEFTVTKKTDTASHSLFKALVEGKHFDTVVVELRRAGSATTRDDLIFMRFTMRMVMVQDISWQGSDGDDICEETVIFQFGAIMVEYIPQLTDGKMDTAQKKSMKWSRIKNNATTDIV